MAADKTSVVSAARTSVVSVLVAKKAATSAATSDISMKSTTPRGRLRRPRGVVDEIEMSDVAADVAAVAAFLAAGTTDVLAADTTDVLSAAKAASGGSCPANLGFPAQVASGGKSSRKLAPPNFGHAGLAKFCQILVTC